MSEDLESGQDQVANRPGTTSVHRGVALPISAPISSSNRKVPKGRVAVAAVCAVLCAVTVVGVAKLSLGTGADSATPSTATRGESAAPLLAPGIGEAGTTTIVNGSPAEPAGASGVSNYEELLDWVGTYSLVEGPARIAVPTDNGLPFVIEKTDTTLCVNGTSCGGLWEGESSFRPQTVASGAVLDEALSGDDRNKVYYWIVPTGVEVRLVDVAGASFCETQATPATGLADATIWTCETRSSIEVDGMDILFVKEGETHSMTYRSDGYEFN